MGGAPRGPSDVRPVSGATFPRSARLLRGIDFQAVFAARQRVSGRFFLIQWLAGDQATARLGLAVSRKVDSRAVQRNRLKRVVRNAFRLQRARLPALDLVVLPKREAVAAPSEALRQDLAQLWQRLLSLPRPEGQGTMPPVRSTPSAEAAVTSAATVSSPPVPPG